jgi:hypothetical protein
VFVGWQHACDAERDSFYEIKKNMASITVSRNGRLRSYKVTGSIIARFFFEPELTICVTLEENG